MTEEMMCIASYRRDALAFAVQLASLSGETSPHQVLKAAQEYFNFLVNNTLQDKSE